MTILFTSKCLSPKHKFPFHITTNLLLKYHYTGSSHNYVDCQLLKCFPEANSIQNLYLSDNDSLTCTRHISTILLHVWTRELKHYKHVKIKQFSKVDIKQDNNFSVILLIKYLVYQLDPHHLQVSHIIYIFVYITKSVITFLYISIIRIHLILIISDLHKYVSSLWILQGKLVVIQ